MEALENEDAILLIFEGLVAKELKGCLGQAERLSLPVQGMKTCKTETYFICLWNAREVLILESPTLMEPLHMESSSTETKSLTKFVVSFGSSIIVNAFFLYEKNPFALDSQGSVYSLNSISTCANESTDHMEVEDIFESSPPSKQTKKWKEKCIKKIDCETLVAACLVSNGVGTLVYKDPCLIVLIFEDLEFQLRAVVNLERFCSQINQSKLEESVMSSCLVATLTPSLKELFQDNLDVVSRDIVVVGLPTGLILWFCPNSPERGPFILCSSYLQIQAIHWIPEGEQFAYLAIVTHSGRVIIFGNREQTTLSLPDNVETSSSFSCGIVTSNRVDCYTCLIKSDTQLSLDCVLMPIKGVCAFTQIPDSDLMLASTVHGSLYRFNPSVVPTQKSSQFVIPPQTILDTMLTQTQNLEETYKQMSLEDEILKAISTASVTNSLPSLLAVKVQVLSDDEFAVRIKTSDLRFCSELWIGCVEVVRSGATSETLLTQLKRDLTVDTELVMNVRHKLYVRDIVRVELLCCIQPQSPILTVSLPEVIIDPSYLLASTNTSNEKSQEILKGILCNLSNETSKEKPQDCRVVIKIPNKFDISSFFPAILQNCKHRIPDHEWNKLEGGKKFSTKLYLNNESVVLNLELKSRELNLDCSSTQLCNQLKEFVFQTMKNGNDKRIEEDLVLDIQGLYQQFEIEIMKDHPDIKLMNSYRDKLRASISRLLPI